MQIQRRSDEIFGSWMTGASRRRIPPPLQIEVLAAIVDAPAHGYEICRRIDSNRPASVYKALQSLVDANLVSVEVEDAAEARKAKRGVRKTYALTDAGVETLATWHARQRRFSPAAQLLRGMYLENDGVERAYLRERAHHLES